jgi:hypothetical protein
MSSQEFGPMTHTTYCTVDRLDFNFQPRGDLGLKGTDKDGAYISYALGRFSPGRHLDDQSSLREIPRRAALTLMVPVSERENDGRKRIDISGS